MSTAELIIEDEIDYESLPGGSLASNLAAGAFAGIMVRQPWVHDAATFDIYHHLRRNTQSCTR